MIPEVFSIPGPWRGKLAVIARPRGGDWLEEEMQHLRGAGFGTVVSLLEPSEAEDLGLAREGMAAVAAGLHFVAFPIPDRDVPTAVGPAQKMFREIKAELDSGHQVAIHCRQSIGRAGLTAAGVLMASGVALARALETVSSARGLAIPETPAQLEWLQRLPASELVSAG